ncbi:MAG: hypothetical protein ABI954_13605 [Pyrinomonadaceae bacterium]
MFDLIFRKTTAFLRASLAVVLSSKLVLACTIIKGSTIIEDNKFEVQNYFGLSLAILAIVSILYFLRQKQGLTAVIFSSLIVLLQPGWHYQSGGDCGTTAVDFASWLFFGASVPCLIYQIASWIFQSRKSKLKLL